MQKKKIMKGKRKARLLPGEGLHTWSPFMEERRGVPGWSKAGEGRKKKGGSPAKEPGFGGKSCSTRSVGDAAAIGWNAQKKVRRGE